MIVIPFAPAARHPLAPLVIRQQRSADNQDGEDDKKDLHQDSFKASQISIWTPAV